MASEKIATVCKYENLYGTQTFVIEYGDSVTRTTCIEAVREVIRMLKYQNFKIEKYQCRHRA